MSHNCHMVFQLLSPEVAPGKFLRIDAVKGIRILSNDLMALLVPRASLACIILEFPKLGPN